MKLYLVPVSVVALETPVLAAAGPSFNNLQFVLLIAINLMIVGLILFCCLVLGAALIENWRSNRLSAQRVRKEEPETGRQPHSSHQLRKAIDGQETAGLGR